MTAQGEVPLFSIGYLKAALRRTRGTVLCLDRMNHRRIYDVFNGVGSRLENRQNRLNPDHGSVNVSS